MLRYVTFTISVVMLLTGNAVANQTVNSTAIRSVQFDDNWAEYPLFNIASQSNQSVELIFSMHEMVIEDVEIDGVPMQNYGVPGVFIPEPGVPCLTGVSRYVALPQGARPQVTIIDSRIEVYHNIEIAPASSIPIETSDDPLKYEKDPRIYGQNAYWPESPVRLSKIKQIRGVDAVIVGVIPFQYNPVTKDLIVYKDIKFRIDFVGGNGHFGEDRLRNRFWEPLLKNHLLNYNSLPKIDFYSSERIHSRDNVEYIIIVPNDTLFIRWADTIMAWRKLQGISAEVFTTTAIGGNTTTAIKNFLQNAYTTWTPAPVAFLILSDFQSSGDAYGVTSQVITHPWGYAAYATDNWYADYNNDTLPEMHHGRICAQSATHLSRMINKFLSYERNPYTNAGFYNNPLIAGGWQTERWFQMACEICRGFFANSLSKTPVTQYAIYSGSPTVGCAWTSRAGSQPVIDYWVARGYIPATNPNPSTYWSGGNAAGINAAINAGAFIVQHRDHGAETGWSEPAYTNTSLDGLTNTMFTFVNSTNCLTGRYHWTSECFTEKFHRIQFGALGLNAASSVSFSFVNDTYIWGMFDCLWPQFDPGYPLFEMTGYDDLRPCMAQTSGKYYLDASWFPDAVSAGAYRGITYGLFHHHTDCFVTLYSVMPMDLTVSHAAICQAGQNYFAVSANGGSVIALTVDGEIIGVAEGTGSSVSVSIIPQTAGDTILVTVTKANYRRYTAEVPVVPVGIAEKPINASAGYIMLAPNPFSNVTRLQFSITVLGNVQISLYDATGALVDDLVNELREPGQYTIGIDSKQLSAGVYFVRVEMPDGVFMKPVTIVK
ncbi:hypothetical protein A2Y85_03080 [candidate division WOR-3 bacterium RBG_13_43_14]|uniref:Secretion system C-terminal sorting domain-containing protein n=1 Tax=candidate division WOR-3 bacterium RBG_13_43_14 TaxID=1802590 RepID=A0A1F4UDM1_UNCW3|nr:MAG: hypothetical protein A2Y85_03080 [candidate division WOR-3 bacterium RBG_13_43_14]